MAFNIMKTISGHYGQSLIAEELEDKKLKFQLN